MKSLTGSKVCEAQSARCGEIPQPTVRQIRKQGTGPTAWIACVTASFVMGFAAALANYFILLPLFETFMPLDQLIAPFGAFLPFIHTKLDIVLFNALPFNILKGLVIGGFTMLTYKRLTPILKGVY